MTSPNLNNISTLVQIVDSVAWLVITVSAVLVHGVVKDIKLKLLELELKTVKAHPTKDDLQALTVRVDNLENKVK